MGSIKYLFLIVILISACNRSNVNVENASGTGVNKNAANDTTSVKGANRDYLKIIENLKGAVISNKKVNTKTFYFSNPQAPDTFMLTVQPALIAESRSELKIIAAGGNIIYTDTFNTRYFIRGIFIPDTTPKDGGQEVYEKYMSRYMNAITKERFESYIDGPIQKIFEDIFVSKDEFKRALNLGEVLDNETLNEIDSTDGKIIWFPCFDCDEGVYYIGYSKQKQKAIKILSTD